MGLERNRFDNGSATPRSTNTACSDHAATVEQDSGAIKQIASFVEGAAGADEPFDDFEAELAPP